MPRDIEAEKFGREFIEMAPFQRDIAEVEGIEGTPTTEEFIEMAPDLDDLEAFAFLAEPDEPANNTVTQVVSFNGEAKTYTLLTNVGVGSVLLNEFLEAISDGSIPSFVGPARVAGDNNHQPGVGVWVEMGQEEAFWRLTAALSPSRLFAVL